MHITLLLALGNSGAHWLAEAQLEPVRVQRLDRRWPLI